MKIDEILGKCATKIDLAVYTDLLITEISKWAEMNGGLSPGCDEDALREYLGYSPKDSLDTQLST